MVPGSKPTTAAQLMTAAVLGTLTVARAAPDSAELAAQLQGLRDFADGWQP